MHDHHCIPSMTRSCQISSVSSVSPSTYGSSLITLQSLRSNTTPIVQTSAIWTPTTSILVSTNGVGNSVIGDDPLSSQLIVPTALPQSQVTHTNTDPEVISYTPDSQILPLSQITQTVTHHMQGGLSRRINFYQICRSIYATPSWRWRKDRSLARKV